MWKSTLLILLLPATLGAPEFIPIQRNLEWNKMVINLPILLDNLPIIQKFLKEHEKEITLHVQSAQVTESLDKAIEASKEIHKNLKALKREVEE